MKHCISLRPEAAEKCPTRDEAAEKCPDAGQGKLL